MRANNRPNFIFMLTVADATVEFCLDLVDEIRPLGLRHIGFKDVGVERLVLEELQRRIKAQGATSYLEVVSTTAETALASARIARDLGIDKLLGGTDAKAMLDVVAGTTIQVFPFAGRPHDHPTKLGGREADIAEDCRRMEGLGAAGVDLLAYRATEADPLDLVRAARKALRGELIIAGSIDSPQRIRALAQCGVDAFTIGTAAITGRFAAGVPGIAGQLNAILAACG
jgi:hypothetical protein